MLANRIIYLLTFPLTLFLLPVSFISNLVLELLVKISLGFLLVPLQVVWMVFIGVPLLGTSLLWQKVPLLRALLAILGVPIALVGYASIILLPSLSVDKVPELLRCETWPFSFQFNRLVTEPYDPGPDCPELWIVLKRLWRVKPLYRPYLSEFPEELIAKIAETKDMASGRPGSEGIEP